MYSHKRKAENYASMNSRTVDPFSGVEPKSTSSAGFRSSTNANLLQLVILALVWYSCAIVTITTSKELMIRAQLPYLLCFCQFLFASVLSYGYLYATKAVKAVPGETRSRVLQISATYTAGFVLTNVAFSLGKPHHPIVRCLLISPTFHFRTASPASVETVKAAEPLSTVLIGLVFMNEAYNARTYVALMPICLGVAMACYNNDSFDMMGFLLAMGSNFCFSARAVYTKMLNSAHPKALSDIGLFNAISVTGLLFLFPVALLMDGSSLWNMLSAPSGIPSGTGTRGSVVMVLLLAALNGAMFAGYNLTSYVVLRHTELVTHSVLNVFRRVFIIVFTTVYFRAQLSMLSVFGILLATAGVLLFGVARRTDRKESAETADKE